MINDQYFPHDATAGNNIKLMILIESEGAKGYGVYWFLLEFLRQQAGYRGKLTMLDMLARRIKTTRAVVMRIITEYHLFVVEEGQFFSPGLVERMRPLDHKRATKSEQCRRAAGAKWLKTSKRVDAGALQEEERREEERTEENTSPSSPPGDEDGGNFVSVVAPPEYALSKETHNYSGLMERLEQLKVSDPREVNAILQLSDYGRMETRIWKLLYHTVWTNIKTPGRYLIAALKKN